MGLDGIHCGVPWLVEKGSRGWSQKRERKSLQENCCYYSGAVITV